MDETKTVPSPTPAPSSSSTMSSSADEAVVFSPELLGMYYSRLFPFQLLHSWMSYDPSTMIGDGDSTGAAGSKGSGGGSNSLFARREFSMTIEPVPGNEVYIRYQSFTSRKELTSAILKRRPTKIDIGAVFNHPPKDNKALPPGKLKTQERELVFDIDLTDYDGVRNCGCSGAKICPICWKLMGMAVQVLDEGLKSDFGFERVAWFYSGRRGVHCWVCDEGARTMTNEARSAVAAYFEVNMGSEKNQSIRLNHPLHPSLSRAYSILEPHFIDSVLPEDGHGLLTTRESWTNLLLTLPECANPVADRLEKKWASNKDNTSPEEKWLELRGALEAFVGKKKGGGGGGGSASKAPKNVSALDRIKIEQWPVATVFRYSYPRLDINVSKMQNHLLKSPFCVHPKTGRVCVPFEAEEAEKFDPFAVPTLGRLMKELDRYEAEHKGSDGEGKKGESVQYDWQKTSLKEPFERFQKKFLVPLMNDLRRSRREEAERNAAVMGDF